MAVYVALLRAVNVGGTGKLSMVELRKLCEAAGFENVATCIQSGNVVFTSRPAATRLQRELERRLAVKVGKSIGVHLRTPSELDAILQRYPFPQAAAGQVIVYFLDRAMPVNMLEDLEAPGGEAVVPSGREVFVHYPHGMGRSKLKLPFARSGTGRNLNTVGKLLELSRAIEAGHRVVRKASR
jgi:uncharacterized protein (DUF1697 family)